VRGAKKRGKEKQEKGGREGEKRDVEKPGN
jgi:hypothetical protein